MTSPLKRSKLPRLAGNSNSRFYQAIAPIYDSLYDEIDSAEVVRQWHILIERYQPIHQAADGGVPKLLDLGCGTGRYLLPWLDLGFRVMGVDISSNMLAIARSRKAASKYPERIRLIHHDVRLPSAGLQSHSPFDLVVAHFNFLNLFPLEDIEQIFGSLRLYLTSGCRFITDCAPPDLIPEPGSESLELQSNQVIERTTRPDSSSRSAIQTYKLGSDVFDESYWFHTTSELAEIAVQTGWILEAEHRWQPELTHTPWPEVPASHLHRICVFRVA